MMTPPIAVVRAIRPCQFRRATQWIFRCPLFLLAVCAAAWGAGCDSALNSETLRRGADGSTTSVTIQQAPANDSGDDPEALTLVDVVQIDDEIARPGNDGDTETAGAGDDVTADITDTGGDRPLTGPTDEQVIAALAALPPLPKPHFAPTVIGLLPEWQEFNRQIVRINRTSFIAGSFSETATRRAIQAAIEANAAEPAALPTTLCMYWTPWAQEYKQEPHPVTDFGPLYVQGLDRMRVFFANQRAWISKANLDYGSNIAVSHITLEIELWPMRTAENVAEWEVALLRRHNECYDMVKGIFPEAEITWFDRGGVHHGSLHGLPAYGENRRFTRKEKGDNCSNFFYTLGMGRTVAVEEMRRSIENIDKYYGADEPIVSFVSLAGGAALTMDSPFLLETGRFRDYELVHSYHIGTFINRPEYGTNGGHLMLGADWSRVVGVHFYPNLLDHKLTKDQVIVRMKHYVAYVCGATDSAFPYSVWPNAR